MDKFVFALTDFLASFSIILVLALIYGAIHRKASAETWPRVILGALFGCVAMLEMQRPLEFSEGVLIDMRNVPIALAGAFLGRPGLAVCLGIALVTRSYLGGVGAFAGVVAMLIAGGMGYLWHQLTHRESSRGLLHMVLLGAMMSTHIIAATLLPPQSFYWFFNHAAGPILALNMLSVPLVALILEHARGRIRVDGRFKAAAQIHPDTSLLTWPHFKRELAFHMTAAPHGTVAGLAVIKIANRGWTRHIFGARDMDLLLDGMRIRLLPDVAQTGLFGLLPDARVVVPISASAMLQPEQTQDQLRAAIAEGHFILPGGLRPRAHVTVAIYPAASHAEMADLLRSLETPKPQIPAQQAGGTGKRRFSKSAKRPVRTAQTDLLFDKAAFLMTTNPT